MRESFVRNHRVALDARRPNTRPAVRAEISYEAMSDGGYLYAALGLCFYATATPGRWRVTLDPCMWAAMRRHESTIEAPADPDDLSRALTRQTSNLRGRIAHWIGECLVSDRWGHA